MNLPALSITICQNSFAKSFGLIIFCAFIFSTTPNMALAADGSELLNKGIENQKLGRYALAIEAFSQTIHLSPQNIAAYKKRAICYAMLQINDRAIEDLTKVIELDPKDMDAFRSRANLYMRTNQPALASLDYSSAIILQPNLAANYLSRSAAYKKLGRTELANADYDKAQELARRPKQVNATTVNVTANDSRTEGTIFNSTLNSNRPSTIISGMSKTTSGGTTIFPGQTPSNINTLKEKPNIAIFKFRGPLQVTYDAGILFPNQRNIISQEAANTPAELYSMLIQEKSSLNATLIDIAPKLAAANLSLIADERLDANTWQKYAHYLEAEYLLVGCINQVTFKGNVTVPNQYGVAFTCKLISGQTGQPIWQLDNKYYVNHPKYDEDWEGKKLSLSFISRYILPTIVKKIKTDIETVLPNQTLPDQN